MGDIVSWDARVGGDARAGAAGSARDPSGVAWDDGDAVRPDATSAGRSKDGGWMIRYACARCVRARASVGVARARDGAQRSIGAWCV
jgi:hypothetical protein